MTRLSKKGERRGISPRKNKKPSPKTGSLKDKLPQGFKAHANALSGTSFQLNMFIPKI